MNGTSEKFLIDANSIITPHLTYYPFDFAAKFWDQLEHHMNSGSIFLMDVVKEEIKKGNDQLSEWTCSKCISKIIDHREMQILAKYAEVLTHVQNSSVYNDKALLEWSQIDIADPWLIAAANVLKYTIITFEKPSGGLNSINPSSHPKIPDLCSAFGVKYNDLFYMMRQLAFIF